MSQSCELRSRPRSEKLKKNIMWRSIVISSNQEFKRQGWNLAGANLLGLAVGLANRHYLYVRPRLTLRDFGYCLAPMAVGGLLACLIAYLAYGTTVLPQMAALGCVLGLLGKSLTYISDQLIRNDHGYEVASWILQLLVHFMPMTNTLACKTV